MAINDVGSAVRQAGSSQQTSEDTTAKATMESIIAAAKKNKSSENKTEASSLPSTSVSRAMLEGIAASANLQNLAATVGAGGLALPESFMGQPSTSTQATNPAASSGETTTVGKEKIIKSKV